MGALGYVMQVPEEEKYLNTKDEMLADLVTALGGRAAEAVKFESVTTGASNDIEQATAKARAMITLYGMSDKFGMVALESTQNRYLDGRRVLNCSEETATEIDKEIQKMLKRAYKQAYKMLKENEALMDKLAEYLIQKETITGKEFMEIFNREYHGADVKETPAIVVDAEEDAYVSGVKLDTDADKTPAETEHDNEAEAAEQSADASETQENEAEDSEETSDSSEASDSEEK